MKTYGSIKSWILEYSIYDETVDGEEENEREISVYIRSLNEWVLNCKEKTKSI